MKLQPVNATVVILAKGHNPAILHPQFLERHAIVPKDWIENPDILCTSSVAVAKFNGENFVLFVDASKFQVTDNAPGEEPGNSPIFQVASDYIGKLPHVCYNAVGLNFVGLIPQPKSEEAVASRFLKVDESWQRKFPPKTVGVKLAFDIAGGHLSISVDSGKIAKEGVEPKLGILVQANFHFDLSGKDDAERLAHAQKILSQHADNYRIVKEHVDAIVGLGA